jgi:hypothetical protein
MVGQDLLDINRQIGGKEGCGDEPEKGLGMKGPVHVKSGSGKPCMR